MVSIITVVRNGATTLERTILSVISQKLITFEYIIIDGKSNDGTLDIIDKYSENIHKFISEPDKGIYDAMNKGISIASGDWVYFLGCDDILYSNTILSEIFNSSLSGVDVIYGNVLYEKSKIIYDGEFDFEKFSNKCVCHQAIFYRRNIFSEYGYFDIKYITTADYVLNVRLFCDPLVRWKYVDKIIAVYNEAGASFSIQDQNYLDDSFEIRYLNFRGHVTNLNLSRIFWSSYPRYFKSHKLSKSMSILKQVVSEIGLISVIYNGFKLSAFKLYGRVKN